MIPVLLILIPLLTGLAAFFFKQDKAIRIWSLGVSLLTLGLSIMGLSLKEGSMELAFSGEWMQTIGSSFSVQLDGMGKLLCLLNAIAYPLVILATWNSSYKKQIIFLR